MPKRRNALSSFLFFSAAILWKISRLVSIVARSLSVRLRVRRCATFARVSVTASSKPSSDDLPRTRALGEVLADALAGECGFFVNPRSLNAAPARAGAKSHGFFLLASKLVERARGAHSDFGRVGFEAPVLRLPRLG